MPLKIGLLVGRDVSFSPAFLQEVERRAAGVTAEYVKLGGSRMNEPCPYAVLIDRISHFVPYYRSYLKNAVLQGVTVVNNPFMWTADDKFFQASLAVRLGVAHPRTVALPNRDYIPGINDPETLRNLVYPLDWAGIVEYVGLPCVLKDAHGGGGQKVSVCRSLDDLIARYNDSGLRTMVVQEFIDWQDYVRCICLGQEEVLPMRYNPLWLNSVIRWMLDGVPPRREDAEQHPYLTDPLPAALERRIVDESLKLVRALGYDMNSVEWAVRDGVLYAVDFMNPVPNMDVQGLRPAYFRWTVEHMADMAIRLAKNPRPQREELRWKDLI